MNIFVLVKEVPDMERVKFDSEKGVIERKSADAEINPFDLYALQAAVDIKNDFAKRNIQCTITALSMGPKKAEATMKDVYARGADRCILITDRRFGGSDTLATSSIIAAAVRAAGEFDLIICGEKTVDGDTAQVGPEVAEILEIPHGCYADKIEAEDDKAVVYISEICGTGQIKELDYPALVSVCKNVSKPVLPGLKRKLESINRFEVEYLSFEDIKSYVKAEDIGGKGSPTKVARIEIPPQAVKDSQIHSDFASFKSVFEEIIKDYV